MRDFDRPLSKRGVDDAAEIAGLMKENGFVPGLILSSSAMRCRQTADAVYRALGRTPVCTFTDDFYQAAPVTYLEALSDNASSRTVLVCGHNPGIEETLLALVGFEAFNNACPYGFPTSGLAVLDHGGTVTGGNAAEWNLTSFIAPQ